jgi:hypothetical protein
VAQRAEPTKVFFVAGVCGRAESGAAKAHASSKQIRMPNRMTVNVSSRVCEDND